MEFELAARKRELQVDSVLVGYLARSSDAFTWSDWSSMRMAASVSHSVDVERTHVYSGLSIDEASDDIVMDDVPEFATLSTSELQACDRCFLPHSHYSGRLRPLVYVLHLGLP